MTAPDLPDDLARLERALQARELPAPDARLRASTLGGVQRRRRQERWSMLSAAAVALVVTAALGRSTLELAPRSEAPMQRADAASLEALGFTTDELGFQSLALSRSRVPRIAPLMGSMGSPAGRAGL